MTKKQQHKNKKKTPILTSLQILFQHFNMACWITLQALQLFKNINIQARGQWSKYDLRLYSYEGEKTKRNSPAYKTQSCVQLNGKTIPKHRSHCVFVPP